MAAQLRRRRFTVDEYYRMGQAGILGEDDRLELLEGEIVEMAPIGSRHQGTVNRLTRLFSSRATASSMVMVQGYSTPIGQVAKTCCCWWKLRLEAVGRRLVVEDRMA